MLSSLKNCVVPSGKHVYRVPVGLCRGVHFTMDLHSDFGRYAGLYEREVASDVRHAMRGVRTAIDVGAADGWYTLCFLRNTRATVYAFEPQWSESLAPNLAANTYDQSRIRLRPEWVGGAGTSLNSLAGIVSYPIVIKVDVDGGEVDVLQSATRLMHPGHTRWIIETHSPALEQDCIAWLRRYGYTPKVVPNGWWRPLIGEHRPLAHNRWLVAD